MGEDALSPIRFASLSLEGFGSYREKAELEFRPLTILCGKNCSGKSTWLKALNLLRDCRKAKVERDEEEEVEAIEGTYGHAVTELYQDMPLFGEGFLNAGLAALPEGSEKKAQATLRIHVERDFILPKIDLSEHMSEGGTSLESDLIWHGKLPSGISIDLTGYHCVDDPESKDRFSPGFDLLFPSGFRIWFGPNVCRTDRYAFSSRDWPYYVGWGEGTFCLGADCPGDNFGYTDGKFYNRNVSEGDTLGPISEAGQRQISIVAKRIRQILDAIFDGYFYLGAIREDSPDVHFAKFCCLLHSEPVRSVGCRGHKAPLLAGGYGNRSMLLEDGTRSLNQFCNSWLRPLLGVSLQPPDDAVKSCAVGFLEDFSSPGFDPLDPEVYPQSSYKSVFLNTQRLSAEANQLSTGFHQVSPMIVQAGLMRQGETFAIENPEVHLHPGLQLELTEFLIAMANSGRQIVVETHSDLVIRRVLRAILKEEIKQEKVRIFFTSIDSEAGTSRMQKTDIDDRGRVANWPKGFLDDDVRESSRLMEAMYGPPPEEGDDE